MISIDRATPYTQTQLKSAPIEKNAAIENINRERDTTIPVVDRRRHHDRRRKGSKILLESRSGRDRRKNSHSIRPSIDIKA